MPPKIGGMGGREGYCSVGKSIGPAFERHKLQIFSFKRAGADQDGLVRTVLIERLVRQSIYNFQRDKPYPLYSEYVHHVLQ